MRLRVAGIAASVLLLGSLSLAARQARPAGEATYRGEAFGFENRYVRVHYEVFESAPADSRSPAARPLVLSIRMDPSPGVITTGPLPPPPGGRPSWRPGVQPRSVRIERRGSPPPPPTLGLAGTDLPRGTRDARAWPGGRLLIATFQPLHYGEGAGGHPSVTVFLSDGVIETQSRGMRQRMGVQAGDAFWFEAGTRLVVLDDYPVGAAIVQILPER